MRKVTAPPPSNKEAAVSFVSAGKTDIGRRRKTNEDAFIRDDALGLYVVADGMGGHAAGEIASSEAVETIYGMIKRGKRLLQESAPANSDRRVRGACRLLESAIQAATYMLFAIAEFDPKKSGMGTTITAVLCVDNVLVVGQVGDSRVYQIRRGKVRQVTEDHTLVAWQVKQGLITEDEAKISPHRNVITRAVGNREYVEVDIGIIDIEPGDYYLLCSDGLHGYLQSDEIPLIVKSNESDAVDELIRLANRRGGKDNITAVVVRVDDSST